MYKNEEFHAKYDVLYLLYIYDITYINDISKIIFLIHQFFKPFYYFTCLIFSSFILFTILTDSSKYYPMLSE